MNARPKAKPFTPNVEGYLFFSPNTKGLSGNPVKIRADLFLDFFCSVDPETHDGQTIIRDIESLKIFGKTNGTPGRQHVSARNETKAHQSRLQQINKNLAILTVSQATAPERTFTTKNVRVFYHVLQKEGDSFPTIYISDIRVASEGVNDAAGLYEYVNSRYGGQQLSKAKSDNLEGKSVYISAASDSAQSAMDAVPLRIIDSKPLLFFNPTTVSDDLSLWKRSRITDATKHAIKELSGLLQANQRRNVQWFIEGEGAAVLTKALASVPGTFEKHSFKFLNARTNLPNLLQELGKRKAQLEGEFLDYERDRTALLALAHNKDGISSQLDQLPKKSGYDRISRHYLKEYFRALGENGNAQAILEKAISVKGSNTTFIEAITLSHKGVR